MLPFSILLGSYGKVLPPKFFVYTHMCVDIEMIGDQKWIAIRIENKKLGYINDTRNVAVIQ